MAYSVASGFPQQAGIMVPEVWSGKILIKFYDSTKPWLEMILLNAKENQSLTQLRDILLPKLLSAELEVSL